MSIAKRGEKHPHAKLTNANIDQIYAMLADGLTQEVIANQFNVAQATISRIKTRVNWAFSV